MGKISENRRGDFFDSHCIPFIHSRHNTKDRSLGVGRDITWAKKACQSRVNCEIHRYVRVCSEHLCSTAGNRSGFPDCVHEHNTRHRRCRLHSTIRGGAQRHRITRAGKVECTFQYSSMSVSKYAKYLWGQELETHAVKQDFVLSTHRKGGAISWQEPCCHGGNSAMPLKISIDTECARSCF